MKAYLVLEDGNVFEGKAFGETGDTLGEVVFNTGMTGYQEILTDPSYEGQIVVMTYPLIGNYGVFAGHNESVKPRVKGFVVREFYRDVTGWQNGDNIEEYMKKHGIMGIEDVDTRALTRIIREKGTMKGIITTAQEFSKEKLMNKIKGFENKDAVMNVTTDEVYHIKPRCLNVAVLDFGVKKSILHSLTNRFCNVNVFPAFATPQQILSLDPDGILLSNGPGDPKEMMMAVDNIKELLYKKPIMGICLGHQMLALALGGDTYKMKYGHRGCNHPVKDLNKDRVYITSQNHGYVVDAGSLNPEKIEITHTNMNDGTVEGFRHKQLPIMSVQFHPEAAPGPQDTQYLFDSFMDMMAAHKRGKQYNYA